MGVAERESQRGSYGESQSQGSYQNQNKIGLEKGSAVGASVRAEEDVDGGGALQAGQRPYQSQRPPAAPRRTQDVEAEAGGAAVAPRQRPLPRRRHPRQGQRRRAYRPSVCYPSSHFQVPRCLLSKVRRRSFEEGN